MSEWSPLKSSTLIPTPVKKIVPTDINGWMETHVKQKSIPLAKPRISVKPKRSQSPNSPISTLATLKRKRQELLQKSQLSVKYTLPTTASHHKSIDSTPPSNDGFQLKLAQISAVEVSDFNPFMDLVVSKRQLENKASRKGNSVTTKDRERLCDIVGMNVTTSHYCPMKLFRVRAAKLLGK